MEWNKDFLKKAGVFALFILGFWVVSMLYLSPAMNGKTLNQGDMTQSRFMRADLLEYQAQTGLRPAWAPNMFGGMPGNLILGKPGGNLIYNLGVLNLFQFVKRPFDFLFLAMLVMFVLLKSVKINNWLAVAGAIGYAFMTFSVISYEAGHITKVQAMAVMPGVLAGLMLIMRQKYIYGILVAGLFFAACLGFFHYQIAYYIGIAIGVFTLSACLVYLKNNQIRHSLLTGLSIVVALVLGVGANINKIVDTATYSSETMRGGSKLASETPSDGPKVQNDADGLSIDYAFGWSYAPRELFTLIVPRFMGGSSNEHISYNEEFGTDVLPLYHGDLQFTSGPIYIGSVFMVLFIAAFVICFQYLKNHKNGNDRNFVLAITVGVGLVFLVSVILALGKYVPINTWLFEKLPYYNKFRTPMMALCLAQMIIPFYSMYGLHLMFLSEKGENSASKLIKPVLISVATLLFITFITVKMQDYSRPEDSGLFNNAEGSFEQINALKSVRASEAGKDFFRTFGFAALALLLVYLAAKKILPQTWAWVCVAVLCAIDLMSVSNRYMNDSNWVDADTEEVPPPSDFDRQLQEVNTTKARVLDLRRDPFNDAGGVPYHRNIGGYHPAKLSDYQDVISYAITPNGKQFSSEIIMNNNALDMLNCAYVLVADPQTGAEQVLSRNTAKGNAWFVKNIQTANTPAEEMELINTVNIGRTAVFGKDDEQPKTSQFTLDTLTAKITQTYFSPDTIKYTSRNANAGLAIFSEVYYASKKLTWKAYIDGKEVPVMKANYILRALEVPAGNREILFVFTEQGSDLVPVEKASSLILLLGLLGAFVLEASGRKIKAINA